jgi:hypothetical protein
MQKYHYEKIIIVKNEIKFLIDSGSEMNIIKISSLKGHLIVNEKDKKKIKGIHASPVETVGSVVIPIFINTQPFVVKFDIVNDNFPIPEAGIIGITFLKLNKVVLDWGKEVLIIPEKMNITNNALLIPPRSNCVLQIKADEKIDHELITVKKYEINEDVIIVNSISPVKGDKIISNIINISEQPFIIDQLTTSNLKWEPYTDNVFLINDIDTEKNTGHSGRIKLLNDSIKTDHLNNEEKQNIIGICNEYSDTFYLEGDQLTATDVVTHTINTPRLTKAINIRPYQLPWAYQTEIENPIQGIKKDNVIRKSVSTFNFPLVADHGNKLTEVFERLRKHNLKLQPSKCAFLRTSILTDCGTNFLSDIFKNMCKFLDIEKAKTTPWHPQTNGFLERSHKTLKTYLRSFVDKDVNWDRLLAYAMFCYNTTVHTSTAYTPYELVFGRKPNIPSSFQREPEVQYNYDNYISDLKRMMQEAHKVTHANLMKKKERNKNYYDKNKHVIKINVGDKVLITEHNKRNMLSRNWTGPYEIIMIHDNENITIKKGRKDYRIHVNNVKKYFETDL